MEKGPSEADIRESVALLVGVGFPPANGCYKIASKRPLEWVRHFAEKAKRDDNPINYIRAADRNDWEAEPENYRDDLKARFRERMGW